jgi:transposase
MVTVRRWSRLPTSLQEELIKDFVGGATARSAALLTGVNRHTATLFFRKLREVIAQRLDEEAPELLGGEVEVDESYFGGRRKGKRGRGAGGRVPVFGLLKRGCKVHAVIIPNVGSTTLFPIIRARIKPDAEFRHMRINHRELFAERGNHINGIENFWSQAKRHLRRYNGIPKAQFPLYLKECEWRFNYRPANRLLATLKTWLNETRSVPI